MVVLDFTRPIKTTKWTAEDRSKYNKAYRETHSQIIVCECGAKFRESSKYNHTKTSRHNKWIAQQSNSSPAEPAEL